jgi:hypothetical protein
VPSRRRILADSYEIGKLTSAQIPLNSEPVWIAVLDFARREIQQGLSRDDMLRLAGRSAEFHAANKALHHGSKLENLAFLPAVYPEDGPEPAPTFQLARRWWQFWPKRR